MSFRRTTTFGLLALLGASLNGCGEPGAPQQTTPTQEQAQAPTASPTPTPPQDAGFLHVLKSNRREVSVITHRIDATGHLTVSSNQQLRYFDYYAKMSGEPLGRYVYVAFDTMHDGDSEPLPRIVSYAPDARDGTLTAISETAIAPPPLSWYRSLGTEWQDIRAGVDRVHASFLGFHTTSSPYHYGHVSAVSDDGRLGPAYFHDFADQSGASSIIDVRAGVVYSTRTAYGGVALNAHAVTTNGRLRRTGTSSSCEKLKIVFSMPLASARGFVFASTHEGKKELLCSWEGPGLTPRAAFVLDAGLVEAFVPSADAEPVQLAVSAYLREEPTSRELRLYAMGDDGSLRLQDAVSTPQLRELLFHPAGRFLFATDHYGDLLVYSFTPQGNLALVEEVSHGAGEMAVTMPRGVAALAAP